MTVSRSAKAAQYTTHQETGGKCYRPRGEQSWKEYTQQTNARNGTSGVVDVLFNMTISLLVVGQ